MDDGNFMDHISSVWTSVNQLMGGHKGNYLLKWGTGERKGNR